MDSEDVAVPALLKLFELQAKILVQVAKKQVEQDEDARMPAADDAEPPNSSAAPLAWLGGTEAEVLGARAMALLQGLWQDRAGTLYLLTPNRAELSLDVLTTRPWGYRKFTEGLVQCRMDVEAASGCVKGVAALRGKGASKFQTVVDGCHLSWRRAGSCQFKWKKLQ